MEVEAPVRPLQSDFRVCVPNEPRLKEFTDLKIRIQLKCCGNFQEVSISKSAILTNDPNRNDVRQNVVCLKCQKLVILEFAGQKETVTCVEQEVIDMGEGKP